MKNWKWIAALLIPALAWGVTEWGDLIVKGSITATQANIDNVRVDGNTISTLDTNGNLVFNLDGTGKLEFTDLTATTVPYLDSNKRLTSSAVTPTELGRLSGVGSALCGKDDTCALTNHTFNADGTGNSITNIENADIKAAAAIAVNKLAALTASRAVVSDGSGFLTQATTTATEIGYVNGVTSAIQTQLDAKRSTTFTVQVLNSGSTTTYTTPAGAKLLRITMIGGGGGGSGSGSASSSSDGGNGGATIWATSGGSTIVQAGAGSGRAWSAANGGAGGSNTFNSPSVEIINIAGGRGSGGPYKEISTVAFPGGDGCTSPLGGTGVGSTGAAGQAAIVNSGSGGAGGGVSAANNGTAIYGGVGGGCGGYAVFTLSSPSATYLYTVGAAGAAGSAGTNGFAGATGGTGKIIVEEFY